MSAARGFRSRRSTLMGGIWRREGAATSRRPSAPMICLACCRSKTRFGRGPWRAMSPVRSTTRRREFPAADEQGSGGRMALTLGRQGQGDARAVGQPDELTDDYVVETGTERERIPASFQIFRLLQAVLIIAIAILSFAVFWMVGLIIGIF